MENVWVAILGSVNVAGLVALVTMLLNLGKLWRTVEDTSVTVAAMSGKLSMLQTEVNAHKVEVAREYVTNEDLKNAVDAFCARIDKLDGTIKDFVIALAKK